MGRDQSVPNPTPSKRRQQTWRRELRRRRPRVFPAFRLSVGDSTPPSRNYGNGDGDTTVADDVLADQADDPGRDGAVARPTTRR